MTAEPSSDTGRIVVGFDGSDSSLDALAWAARQAVLTDSTLEVVMTWEWPTSYGWAVPVPDDFDPESESARRSTPRLRGRGGSSRPEGGAPADQRASGTGARRSLQGRRSARRRQPRPRRVRRHADRLGQRVLRDQRALPRARASRARLDAPAGPAPLPMRARRWRGVPSRRPAAGRARDRRWRRRAGRRRAHRAARRASPPPTMPAPPGRTRLRGTGPAGPAGARTRARCGPARRSPRSRAAGC